MSLAHRLVVEGWGTAFLLAVVIGSSSIGERLAGGNIPVALLRFTASMSFANPAVTIARATSNTLAGIPSASVAASVVAQLLGAAASARGALRLLPLPQLSD